MSAFPGRARDLSMVTTLSYCGGLIGPAVIGGVASRASLPAAMAVPAALVAAVTVIAPRVLAALTTGQRWASRVRRAGPGGTDCGRGSPGRVGAGAATEDR